MKACVDIGGTKVAVSLAQAGSTDLIARQNAPTAKTGDHEAVARQVMQLIEAACAEAGVPVSQVDQVGVSSAGPFVLREGAIALATPNICGGLAGPDRGLPNDWTFAPIEAPLAARFGRVRVENDAVAALEAERRWGALKGEDHCAYVTWSTGVGVGLCVDGRTLRGKNGNAGHAGHLFVSDDDNEALCGCGNRGDVESLVAGNAIARRFGVEAAELFGAAQQGDAKALATVDGLCRVMGRLLYNLTAALDLSRISLGGSVFWHNRDFLLPRLQSQLDGRLPALTDGVPLVAAGLGDKVGDYAALALVD
ncbi:ROK family protein [Pseudacidovorax intermedius]|uniref:ROK family transcriptional regulator n=1 Tax=Pseudacidovorax intermedius TaxID=433924 RepID=A0A147GW05_9BURK|nr:ROK family protein [Pseudacidovorax intermedius]KTT21761.1 ROK family transcriptional regulator [Pseudacidovorax intermedius]